jgi:hypothetical protein
VGFVERHDVSCLRTEIVRLSNREPIDRVKRDAYSLVGAFWSRAVVLFGGVLASFYRISLA